MNEAIQTREPATIELGHVHARRGRQRILSTGEWKLPADSHGLIRGASGSGKTTLLHLIAGLEAVQQGSLRVLGLELNGLDRRQRDRFRARNIGLVFQDFHLLPGLSVEDNLRLPPWFAGLRPDPGGARNLLGRLGIGKLAARQPHELSQGEKQRVAIARSVINRPRLILADEPTSALDDDNAMNVLDLLREEAGHAGASLLIASHDRRLTDTIDLQLLLEAPQ